MRRLAVPLAALALLAAAPAAEAGEVAFGFADDVGGNALAFRDLDGADDQIAVGVSDDRTVVGIGGPGVVAGNGCEQVTPELVACENPGAGLVTIALDLGAGDDGVLLEPQTAGFDAIVDGGPGNDRLRGHGRMDGNDGDDVIEVVNPVTGSTLEGGAGDDQLVAGSRPASLGGGLGTDRLQGGRGNDVLVDVGDGRSGDTISCGGGSDLVERDPGDRVQGCPRSATNDIARVKHRWRVYGHGYTEPVLLRITLPNIGQSGIATALLGEIGAICQGRGCFGAKFRTQARGLNPPKARFVLSRGGIRIPGTKARGFRPGAKIIVLYRIELSGVVFAKGVRFTVRRRKLPKVDTGCAVQRPGESKFREIPCA